MSGVFAGATVVAGLGGAALNKSAAGKAARASENAAGMAYDADMAALDYMREVDEVPRQFREQALQGLGAYYQVPGEQMDQQGLIDQARSSPLYAAIMGTRGAGEDSILRNASATGGLRSGASQGALTDYNMNLENDALLQSFMQEQQRQDYERALHLEGLTGLANLPGNQNAIAGLTSQAGHTRAMGMTAAAQARQQGTQNALNTGLGVAQLGLQAYGQGMFRGSPEAAGGGGGANINMNAFNQAMAGRTFSDIRLKTNIRPIGERNGFNLYSWDWNELGESIGLTGSSEGVLAHEVYEVRPEAVGVHEGFVVVDYGMLEAH